MRRFHCTCGQPVFFENDTCLACRRNLGYWAPAAEMVALEGRPDGTTLACGGALAGRPVRRCRNGLDHRVCNWLLGPGEPGELCRACRLNRTIPNLDSAPNLERWRALEVAKRRLLYTLIGLGLPLDEGPGRPAPRFDFLEDRRTNPSVGTAEITTGHLAGLVTINVAEADAEYRERERIALGEPYRTLLGHFRHEIGHYYWQPLIAEGGRLAAFRALFGDERSEYAAALERFYAAAPRDWQGRYISAYASAHPVEDWAESFAHFLHMTDTLETARAWGLIDAPAAANPELAQWLELTVALNELNRSMGLADVYPFVLSAAVAAKLAFIGEAIAGCRPR